MRDKKVLREKMGQQGIPPADWEGLVRSIEIRKTSDLAKSRGRWFQLHRCDIESVIWRRFKRSTQRLRIPVH